MTDAGTIMFINIYRIFVCVTILVEEGVFHPKICIRYEEKIGNITSCKYAKFGVPVINRLIGRSCIIHRQFAINLKIVDHSVGEVKASEDIIVHLSWTCCQRLSDEIYLEGIHITYIKPIPIDYDFRKCQIHTFPYCTLNSMSRHVFVAYIASQLCSE